MRIAIFCDSKYIPSFKMIMKKYDYIDPFYICISNEEQKIGENEYHIKIVKNYEYPFLELLNIDLVLVYSWKYLIPENVLNKLPVYNFHPSLLPKYRGPIPIVFQILNEEKTGGVTLHKVDRHYDNGAIYTQVRFNISESDTNVILEMKIFKCIRQIIDIFLKDLFNQNIKLTEQDTEKATYYSYGDLESYIIDNSYSFNKFLQISRYIHKIDIKIKMKDKIYLLKNYRLEKNDICKYEYSLTDKKVFVSVSPHK